MIVKNTVARVIQICLSNRSHEQVLVSKFFLDKET